MKMSHIAAALGLAAVASFASASVTYDPLAGGFVGKGDVQLAFGLNNATLQKEVKLLSFTYNVSKQYEAVCTWITGEGKNGQRTHNVNHTEIYAVNSTVGYDARVKSQITGFFLKPVDLTAQPVLVGTEPVKGQPCPGNEGHAGTWSSATLVSESALLMATWNGATVPMPNTPVL